MDALDGRPVAVPKGRNTGISDMATHPPSDLSIGERKRKFGHNLQARLDERHWSQSDLMRQVEAVGAGKIGRDAISTYINGRSFPTPKSLNQLCRAFGLKREELLSNSIINATQDEHRTFEMRAAVGQPGRAWVHLNRMMSFETATEIARLLNAEEARGL
jgi:transcriptional regulator with XRE-family HTH domain